MKYQNANRANLFAIAWRGVKDADGNEAKIAKTAFTEFMTVNPRLFDHLQGLAMEEAHFLESEAEDLGKNSPKSSATTS